MHCICIYGLCNLLVYGCLQSIHVHVHTCISVVCLQSFVDYKRIHVCDNIGEWCWTSIYIYIYIRMYIYVIVVSCFLQCMGYVPCEGCTYFRGRSPRKYIQYEGGTYPMHCKNHETAVLYNRPRKATAQR